MIKYGIIEVTTSCQLKCPGCYMVRNNALNHGSMGLAQAINVLKLCRTFNGCELETMDILGGEPLRWMYLKPFVEELLRRGIKPWIFTNMLAISPKLAAWLYERNVSITGKLNIGNFGDPRQLSVQASVINGSLKQAQWLEGAVKVFQNAGYQSPNFTLENLIRLENMPYAADFYRFCLRNNIKPDIELLACGEGLDAKYWQIAPSPQQVAGMIRQLQEVRREFGLEPAKVLMPHVFSSCRFYDNGLYFACDGAIRACSNSNIPLSSVCDDDPIRKAFESQLLCNRRKLNQGNVSEPCRSCDRWDECRGGCRATVEGSGNSFGGYELCPVPHL